MDANSANWVAQILPFHLQVAYIVVTVTPRLAKTKALPGDSNTRIAAQFDRGQKMREISTLFLTAMMLQACLAEDRVRHTIRYFTEGAEPQRFETMAFSSRSDRLAVSIGGKVEIIGLKRFRSIHRIKANPFTIAFSRDDSRVYMIARNRDYVIDTKSWQQIPTTRDRVPGFLGLSLAKESGKLLIQTVAPGGPASKAAIDVGDELIGVAEGRKGKMNVAAGKPVGSVLEMLKGPAGTFVTVNILPQGMFGDDNAIDITLQRHARQHDGTTDRFELTPRVISENLAPCISTKPHRRQEFRDASNGKSLVQFATVDVHNKGLGVISVDQNRFAIVAEQKSSDSVGVEIFDIVSRRRLAYIPLRSTRFYSIAFSTDGNRVLVATENGVEILDIATQDAIAALTPGNLLAAPLIANEANLGAEAVGTAFDEVDDGTWTTDSSRVVKKIAVSSDNVVATADAAGRLILWDYSSRSVLEQLSNEQSSPAQGLLFSPDGKWLAYYVSGMLHVLDTGDLASRERLGTVSDSNSLKVVRNPTEIPGLDLTDFNSGSFVPRDGARVDVRSRGRWFPATIVQTKGSGLWIIHYDESPEDWDEIVSKRRLRDQHDR